MDRKSERLLRRAILSPILLSILLMGLDALGYFPDALARLSPIQAMCIGIIVVCVIIYSYYEQFTKASKR